MPKKKAVDKLQNELLLIFSLVVVAITYIYCFPYVQFFSGFISSPALCLLNMVVYMVMPFLLVACAVISVSRIFIYRKELKTPTKMMLCAVALCAGGVIPLSIGNRSTSELTYLHGFRTRIQRRLDADAIRKWMQEVELDADLHYFDVDLQKAPSFIRVLDPSSARVEESIIGEDGRIGRIASFHWPAVGGIRMVVAPQGVDYIGLSLPDALPVVPGVHVWSIPK
jgi:hypothetical protein